MPIIEFEEFKQYPDFKGIFVGGCVERGNGSSFRAKAHAHCLDIDVYYGWICVRSAKRLRMNNGNPSILMLHELAHLLTKELYHNDKWRRKNKELGGWIEKRYRKRWKESEK